MTHLLLTYCALRFGRSGSLPSACVAKKQRNMHAATLNNLLVVTVLLAAVSSLRLSRDGTQRSKMGNQEGLEPRSSYQKTRAEFFEVAKWSGLLLAGAGAGAGVLGRPRVVVASDALAFPPDCSDSVSVLKGPMGREVCIIGTAHISEESAEVVRRTVRSLKPDTVMIELDEKRMSRVVDSSTGREVSLEERGFILPMSSSSASQPSPSSVTSVSPKASNPGPVPGFMAMVGKTVQSIAGNALKKGLGQFYDSVEKLGFSAGKEFIVAVDEAKTLNARVLLGDQDVDLTLKNLASALARSDADKFLSLVEKLDDAERELGIEIPQGGGGADDAMTKAAMSSLVEKLKTRKALDKIMGTLRSEAPAIYQAMIGDRDSYMAASIATQTDSKRMVAVCGMAHMAGIERNLASRGFIVAERKC